MKNYVDHSRLINSIIAVVFSICLCIPAFSFAEVTSKATNTETTSKISINHATETELIKLKGIGAKKAKAIIDYREKNGAFSSVDDLANIKGIGTKIITQNHLIISI